jgi:hypothetical protein
LYCGIDLHARTMYRCLLHQEGAMRVHRPLPAGPAPCLKAVAPYRQELVVCVACLVTWSWLADRWAREEMPLVRGPALSLQALHGGTAQNAKSEAHKMAVRLRGGLWPQAYG